MGVSSPLTLSRPLSLRSPPRLLLPSFPPSFSLPPSLPPATAAFITARRREGGIAFVGSQRQGARSRLGRAGSSASSRAGAQATGSSVPDFVRTFSLRL